MKSSTTSRQASISPARALSMALAALTCVLLMLSVGLCGCGEPAISEQAVGSWREIGTDELYTMRIDSAGAYQYEVDYGRASPQSAHLDGEKLLLTGLNSTDIVFTVTYDEDADQLTAEGPLGTFVFEREQE